MYLASGSGLAPEEYRESEEGASLSQPPRTLSLGLSFPFLEVAIETVWAVGMKTGSGHRIGKKKQMLQTEGTIRSHRVRHLTREGRE